MRKHYKISSFVFFAFICCGQVKDNPATVAAAPQATTTKGIIDSAGKTVQARFNTPPGFKRLAATENSFSNFLRNLPLKPAGAKVKYYDGSIKDDYVYDAVVDMDIGKKDLQQCADAVMRLRGEYFYSRKEYDKISFTLTNGFTVAYTEWIKGNRIVVNGNRTSWKKSAAPSNTYQDFRNYMDLVFMYAGSLSLSKELHPKKLEEISGGDVFIVGGSPGHAVIVIDAAKDKSNKRIFLLAQSYMPAQETQVLKNLNDSRLSPWYSSDIAGNLATPQWSFETSQLKSWER